MDNELLGIAWFDEEDDTKLLLFKLPLKLCKLLWVSWEGPGPGESAPDESSDSAPEDSPDLSSWKERECDKMSIFIYFNLSTKKIVRDKENILMLLIVFELRDYLFTAN